LVLAKEYTTIAQTFFGTTTLYRTIGDQIDRYGYAAFGLTVTPYAYMSLIKLFANLLCPEFPARYLVESLAMREAASILRREEQSAMADVREAKDEPTTADIGDGEGSTAANIYLSGRAEQGACLSPQVAEHDSKRTKERLEGLEVDQLEVAATHSGEIPCSERAEREASSRPAAPSQNLHGYDDTAVSPRFLGVIGALDEGCEHIYFRRKMGALRLVALWATEFLLPIAVSSLPIAVVGALSKFQNGSMSTHAQRVWMMTWLSFGIWLGPSAAFAKDVVENRGLTLLDLPGFLIMLAYGAPAIGGFVAVAQMISAYGVCFKIA
jgi:hypothetical protein